MRNGSFSLKSVTKQTKLRDATAIMKCTVDSTGTQSSWNKSAPKLKKQGSVGKNAWAEIYLPADQPKHHSDAKKNRIASQQ